MNCDEFLESLISPDERWQNAARGHANSCPGCALLAKVQTLLQKELAASESLPPRLRALWEVAANESPPTALTHPHREGLSYTRQLPMQFVSIAAALLLLLTVGFLIWHRPGEVMERPTAPTTVVKAIDAYAELNNLLAEISALEVELENTSKQAELVDVRREADALLATHSHW